MKKKEIYIFSAIFLLTLLCWIGMDVMRSKKDFGSIRITIGGEVFGIYGLGDDQVIDIGTGNICEIRDGKVKMTEADCPDHLCMRQPAVDKNGGSIICLPHRVVIEGIVPEDAFEKGNTVDAIG